MDIFVFVVLLLYFEWAHAFHEIQRQPPYTPFLTYPFEGVDYNELPDKYKKEHNDCYAYYLRCIRYRTDLHAVCGLNTQSGYLEEFFSPCQIDFMNCQHRMSKGTGVTGFNYRDDLIAYNGEGNKCQFYLRTAGDPESALRMYKNTLPIIVNKEELNILRKGGRPMRILKGNMNFDGELIAKIDSMFEEGAEETVRRRKGEMGLKNHVIPKLDTMLSDIRDKMLTIRKGNIGMDKILLAKINSTLAVKVGEIPKIPKSLDKNGVKVEINSVSKDKGENMIDELVLMNKKLYQINLEMNQV